MKIGIFGGTFNPPHMGHITAARSAVTGLELDRLLMIPANIPSHKQLPPGSPSPQQRLEMVRLAAKMVPNARASDIELKRGGSTYTVDTVRELVKKHPRDELWFIMGTDSYQSFDKWVEPDMIALLCKIAVVSRSHSSPDLTELAGRYAGRFGMETFFVENDVVEVSSTQLRKGKNMLNLPGNVGRYIRENCLYVDLPALRRRIAGMVSQRRFAHVLGCEKMAAELAEKWGGDVQKARVAALLHDMTKDYPMDEQLLLVKKWDIIIDYTGDRMADLIHADTAAEMARREFGVGRDVADAIRYHSTGRESMTLLDKIIYVADKCEETRDYPDVPALRELAFTDLDAAVTGVLESCLLVVERRGHTPDVKTRKALAYMKGIEPNE